MSLQKDIPQPDERAWFTREVLGEASIYEAPLQEEDDANPLDYELAIDIAGANAVWEPYYQTPEEKALAEEQLAEYAGTHEQSE